MDLLGEVLNGSGRECGYPGKGGWESQRAALLPLRS